jgi:predicted site-specific integrase-resolvase
MDTINNGGVMDNYIGMAELAKRVGAKIDTVRGWAERGKIKGVIKTPGKRYMISETDAAVFVTEFRKPVEPK